MMVWHVTTLKKLAKYVRSGEILPPVRAWKTIEHAQNFSTQTGRQVILRLKFPDDSPTLGGHKGNAVVLNEAYKYPPVGGA